MGRPAQGPLAAAGDQRLAHAPRRARARGQAARGHHRAARRGADQALAVDAVPRVPQAAGNLAGAAVAGLTPMIVLRNIAFYLVFFPASAFFVSSAAVAAVIAPRHVRMFPDTWSHVHRWCVTVLLGIEVRETGSRPSGPA